MASQDFDTLSEASQALNKQGYTKEFNLEENCLVCVDDDAEYTPEEFEVDAVYRFEGMTDPGDNMTLYAISSSAGSKGQLIVGMGAYADNISPKLLQKLEYNPNR